MVVVDLRRVEFFGSVGLAALAKHRRGCARLGASLCVVAPHRPVLRPMEITRLDREIAVVTTVEEAIARSGRAPTVGWDEVAVEEAEGAARTS